MSPIDQLDSPQEETLEPPTPEQMEAPEIPAEEPQVDQEQIGNALKQLLLDARNEDRFVRDNYLLLWRKLEYYWNNILDIFMDPVSHDWRVPDWDDLAESGEVPPRLINIYRPHGEAIVAALSVQIPSIIFHPDDADNPDDVETSRAYGALTKLLQLHNEAPMMFIKMIMILFNQGTIFGYNYYHANPKFGTIKKPKVEYRDISLYEIYCPQCGAPQDAGAGTPQQNMVQCQECGYQGPGQVNSGTERIPQIVGFNETPKGSVCQEIFSGLNVKIPAFATKQEECGYLMLEFLQSTAMLRSIFQDKAEQINSRKNMDWENFSKIPLQYYGDMPDNASNVTCIWLRPWQFWQLKKKEDVALLTQQFPDGCYAIFIDDEFMEAYPEKMDEHWTMSANPMSRTVYARPLGENLATVQDIRAQLVEIEVQTAEFGIPETFADPQVLDFEKYGVGRSKPGMVTQAKPRPGKSIGDAFHTTKPAILSQEIDPLRQHIDQDAQFVTGSFPSVYGGPATGGSQTASEYSQSRAVALQRLGTIWKIACAFWANFQSRSVVEYANVIRDLNQDQRFTQREGKDGFVNVWIRVAALQGKVGHVEPESSENLPTSWAQRKDVIQQLILTNNEQILMALFHPRNLTMVKEAVGLPDLYIPGEEDRMRQFKEYQIMTQGIPVPTNPMVDNEQIHVEILQSILEGPLSDDLSPEGRQACMQHLMEHQQSLAQKAEMQQESAPDKPAQKENPNAS